MHATCVEDLLVYRRSKAFMEAVFEISRSFDRTSGWRTS